MRQGGSGTARAGACIEATLARSTARRGSFYFHDNRNTRVGALLAGHVVRAALEGRIGFNEAYDLTGLRGGAFQEYASRLGAAL